VMTFTVISPITARTLPVRTLPPKLDIVGSFPVAVFVLPYDGRWSVVSRPAERPEGTWRRA
jgi:hypothetical protein